MDDSLFDWEITSTKLADIGKRVRDINREVLKVAIAADDDGNYWLPNPKRAKSVVESIRKTRRSLKRINPEEPFDETAHSSFHTSLDAQEAFVRLTYDRRFRANGLGAQTFFNTIFGDDIRAARNHASFFGRDPTWYARRTDAPFGYDAVGFIDSALGNIPWDDVSAYEDLEFELLEGISSTDDLEEQALMMLQIPRLRRHARDWSVDLGVYTSEEADAIEASENERMQRRLERIVTANLGTGATSGELYRAVHAGIAAPDAHRTFPFYADYSFYGANPPEIGMKAGLFLVIRDKNTGEERVLTPLLDRVSGHENVHRFQRRDSQHFPVGLREEFEEFNLNARIMVEGVAVFGEEPFTRWLYDREGAPRKERRLSALNNVLVFNSRLRSIYAPLNKALANAHGNDPDLANSDLADISGIELYRNWLNGYTPSLLSVSYYPTYMFGEAHAQHMHAQLVASEGERLGSRQEGKRFVQDREKELLRGMFMASSLPPRQFKDFMLNQYWPRVRETTDD